MPFPLLPSATDVYIVTSAGGGSGPPITGTPDTTLTGKVTFNLTVPAGVTSSMTALIWMNGSTTSPATITASKTGAVFSYYTSATGWSGASANSLAGSPVTTTNSFYAVWKATGLTAGDTVVLTCSPNATLADAMHVYLYNDLPTAGAFTVKSATTTTAAAITTTAGQKCYVLSLSRAGVGVTRSSISNSLGFTTTNDYALVDGTTAPACISHVDEFVATGTSSGVTTETYSQSNTNGGAVTFAEAPASGGSTPVDGAAISIAETSSVVIVGALTSAVPGGVGTTTAKVRLDAPGATSGTVTAATNTGLTTGVVTSGTVTFDSDGLGIATLTGLTAGTDYFFGATIDGIPNAKRGNFRTAVSGGYSYSFVTASCLDNTADPTVLNSIRTRTGAAGGTAEFFAMLGDIHYHGRTSSSQSVILTDFRDVVARTNAGALFAAMPWEYTWSDHDLGIDNCDSVDLGSACINANRAVFGRYFPTYDLPAVNTDGAPYRSWVRGRVRFIMTDGRTYMSDIAATDNSSKTKWGAVQKQWVKDESAAAAAAGQVLVLLNEDGGWTSTGPFTGDDSWAAYTTERQEMFNYWTSIGMNTNMMIIHGDYHNLGVDDGSHNSAGIPIILAAPLHQTYTLPSQTQWSGGHYPLTDPGVAEHQYGWFDVTDSGTGTVTIAFTGYSNDNTGGTSADTSRLTFSKTFSPGSTPITGTEAPAVTITESKTLAGSSTSTDTCAVTITESRTLAGSSTSTDTCAVTITETSSVAVTFSTTDSCAVTITENSASALSSTRPDTAAITIAETDTTTAGVSASESEAITIADASQSQSTLSTNDTAAVTIADTSSANIVTAVNSAGDTTAVTITDASAVVVQVNTTDACAITISDASQSALSLSRTESVAVTIADVSASALTTSTSDSCAITITESSNPAPAVPGSETIAVSISEVSAPFVIVNTTDACAITITETDTTTAGLSRPDTCAITISDVSSSASTLSTVDQTAITIADASAVTAGATASESVAVTIAETSAVSGTVTTTESCAITVTESSAPLVMVSTTDACAVSIADSSSLVISGSATITGSESVAVTIAESSAVFKTDIKTASESVAVTIAETSSSAGTLSTSETVAITITDTSASALTLSRTDTTAVTIADVSNVGQFSNFPGSESIAITVTDSSSLVISGTSFVSATDAVAVTITETSSIQPNTITSDTAAVTIAETSSVAGTMTATETAAVTITETSASSGTMTRTDTCAVTITESSSVAIISQSLGSDGTAITISETSSVQVFGTIPISASDTAAITIAESRTLAQTLAVATSDTTAVTVNETSSVSGTVVASDNTAVSVDDQALIGTDRLATDATSIAVAESSSVFKQAGVANIVSTETIIISINEFRSLSDPNVIVDPHIGGGGTNSAPVVTESDNETRFASEYVSGTMVSEEIEQNGGVEGGTVQQGRVE